LTFRRGRWLAFVVIGLALVTMLLTWSRGPLIAIGVAAVLAVLASGHVERRFRIAGLVVGAITLLALIAVRYGTNVEAALSAISGSSGEDVDRVNTWIAAISITIANPLVGGGWRSLDRFGNFSQQAISYSHDILLHGFSEGGLPLGITNATVILCSAWQVWRGRHTMAPYLIAAVVVFLVCGFWDIPQVRSYAAVMGGIAMGMAAGPLIGRPSDLARPAV
jgi:O-Antigen ligase